MLGGIANAFTSLPGGPFKPAVIASNHPVTLDAGGSIAVAAAAVERDCYCQVDSVTDAMQREEGYQQKDVALIILRLDGTIDQGERVTVDGATYRVESVATDPLGLGYVCRGRAV